MVDEHTLARVRRLLAGRDGVVEKRMVGGLSFTGLTLYATHVRTGAKRDLKFAG